MKKYKMEVGAVKIKNHKNRKGVCTVEQGRTGGMIAVTGERES